MLIAQNLEKKYFIKEKNIFFRKKKEIEAVKNVSLKIEKGKIIGLLGENGAGKTTTIKMLTTLLKPTSGCIKIDDIDAIKNPKKAKFLINLISGGERNIYWRLTARENLEYFASLYNLDKRLIKSRVEEILKIVDIEEFADIPLEKYSKGMKQRVQIARGLINDPSYIFLDEPTLGLDVLIAKELRLYIKNLAHKENKGILLTSHYIHEVEELCDYIYILNKGSIIAEGTINELKKIFNHIQKKEIKLDRLTPDISTSIQQALEKYKLIDIRFDYDINTVCIKYSEDILLDIMISLQNIDINIKEVITIETTLEDILIFVTEQEALT